MKKVIMVLSLIVLSMFLISCDEIGSKDVENDSQIYAIYELAVSNANYDGTYEEWLESVKGPKGDTGHDGREIRLQVSGGYIQWQYDGDTAWSNLVDLVSLTGSDGQEVMFQIDGDMLQWKYVGDDSWTNLIVYNNINDGYYLTDEEINHILINYTEDIKKLFPTIDLNTLNDTAYENNCDSVDYEICNNIDNYPMIFAEGYEKFVDKQKSIDLLGYAMKSISDLMGTFESEPIVPNDYLSGTDALASVKGRNNTSILFEGNLDGSVPIDIPIDIQFTYQLLIYKSIDDNKIYVEGNISFGSGILFWDLEIANTSFLSTYSMNFDLDNFIYITDIVGSKEWVTVMQPTIEGVEIYSTNQESLEYFVTSGDYLEVMYSTNWFLESPNFSYEIYNSNQFIYRMNNDLGNITYQIPMSSIVGWTDVEFTNDSKWGDNDLSFRVSKDGVTIIENLATESQVATEPAWILSYDYKVFFDNQGDLDYVNASNTIILRIDSRSGLEAFLGAELAYSEATDFEEYLHLKKYIENYMFLNYQDANENFDEIFSKFNLYE